MPRVSSFTSPDAEAVFVAAHTRALSTLPPHDVEQVPTNWGSVHVLRFGPGAGVPIVLLHGMSCTSAMWKDNVGPLAHERPVVAIDSIVDCGGSRQTAPVADLAELVQCVVQVLDSLGIREADFVGLSYGAWTAAGCAVFAPTRVRSLTLLEPAATIHGIGWRYWWGLLKSFVRKSPRRWDFLFHHPPARELLDILDASRGFRPRGPLPRRFSDDQLRAISAPVRVVLGADSTACDVERTRRRLTATLPDTRLVVVDRAGHMVSVDQPEDTPLMGEQR